MNSGRDLWPIHTDFNTSPHNAGNRIEMETTSEGDTTSERDVDAASEQEDEDEDDEAASEQQTATTISPTNLIPTS